MAEIQHSKKQVDLLYRYDWIRYVVLVVLLIMIVVVAGVSRNYILRKSQYFQEEVLTQIERAFDVRIEYTSISPTFWGWFHVNGVAIHGKGMQIAANRLTIHFDAFALIMGRHDISLVRKIDINGVQADIEQLDGLSESIEKTTDHDSVESSEFNLENSIQLLSNSIFTFLLDGMNISGLQLELSLRNVNVHYRAQWGTFVMGNLLFTINPVNNLYQIELSAIPELMLYPDIYVKLPLRVSGQVAQDLLFGDLRFDVTNTYQNIINIEEQGMRVQWRDGVLNIRKNVDSLPIDYGVRIDAVERSLYTGFNAYQFSPQEFLHHPSIEKSSALFQYLDGFASLFYYPDQSLLYYGGDLLLALRYAEQDIRVQVSATGNIRQLQVRNLEIQYENLSYARFSGIVDWKTRLPQGTLNIFWDAPKPLDVELLLLDQTHFLQVSSNKLSYNHTMLGDLSLLLFPESKIYRSFIEFTPISSTSNGVMQISGLLDLRTTPRAELFVNIQDFALATLAEASILPTGITDWSANGIIDINWNDNRFLASVRDLSIEKDVSHRISLSAVANPDWIDIQSLSFLWGNYFAKLHIESEFSKTPHFSGALTSLLTDYAFMGDWDGEKLQIRNEYAIFEWDMIQKQGKLTAVDMPLRSTLNAPILNMESTVKIEPQLLWEIPSVSITGNDFIFQMTGGKVTQHGGNLGRIRYHDTFADLFGNVKYERIERLHKLQLNMVSNDLPMNREIHAVVLEYEDDLSGSIQLTRFPLARLRIPELEGLFNLNLDIHHLKNHPNVSFSTNLLRGFYHDTMVQGSMNGEYSERGLSLSQLSLQYGDHLLRGGTFLGNFQQARLTLAGEYTQVNKDYQLGFSAHFRPQRIESPISFSHILQNPWQLLFNFEPLMMNQRVALRGSRIMVAYDDGTYTVNGLDSLNLEALYNTDSALGFFRWNGADGFVIHSDFNLNQEEYHIDLKKIIIPLGFFNPFFTRVGSTRILGFERGLIEGNLSIRSGGMLEEGIFRISDDAILSLLHLPRENLGIGGVTISIDSNKLRLNPINIDAGGFGNRVVVGLYGNAEIGNPTFSYTVGLSVRPKKGPQRDGIGVNYDINIGENIVRLKGRAQGMVFFEGDTAGARLSGDIYLASLQGNLGALSLFMNSEAVKRRRIPTKRNPKPGFLVQAASKEDAQYRPLRLITGNDVVFYIPDSTIPTIELTTQAEQELILVLDIQKGAPIGQNFIYLEGDIGIRRGQIRMFSSEFSIRNGGILRFNEEYGFNPMLIFLADLKMDDGHIITMEFEDQAINNRYDFRLTSSSLSQTDIMHRLGMSLVPSLAVQDQQQLSNSQAGDDSDSNSFNALKTVIEPIGGVAEEYLSRQLERVLRFIPFVDSVNVRTSAVSNLALSRFSANSSTDSEWAAGANASRSTPWDILDGTSISAGFRITPVFTVEASFGMAKESARNQFFEDTSKLLPNLGIGLKFDTPIFLVSWSFNPTLADSSLQQLFVGSVSLNFTKTFYFRDWADLGRQLNGGSL
ncbi:hypothetical protein PVA44_06340 [Entomospira nematocerorum]|uniref:Translocation/assembly module TamB n=1 Tax=Entomospira nematocerorum TaxID=2719987 RepID=A0A968GDL8_9SPIO|nr:hypothetical protein [Entomospira nematocera]NIZ46360.1 hypothetical protein [Entomospira nematocera]WDI33835.1 hypothetical protein PVA44_06340 [Entomospira nematocera]